MTSSIRTYSVNYLNAFLIFLEVFLLLFLMSFTTDFPAFLEASESSDSPLPKRIWPSHLVGLVDAVNLLVQLPSITIQSFFEFFGDRNPL